MRGLHVNENTADDKLAEKSAQVTVKTPEEETLVTATVADAPTHTESNVVADETAAVPPSVETEVVAPPAKKALPKQRRVAVKRPKLARRKPKIERVDELKRHDTDVGSSEIQIGLLTDRIVHLTAHLKIHPKDKHTNYGLRNLISQRKRLLSYLNRTKPDIHKKIKVTLNMR